MSTFRSYLGWGAAAVCALSVSFAGCGKKDEKKEGDKSEKATKDDDEGGKKKGGDAKYATGTVLKHLPKGCKGGRIYLNVGLFLKNEGTEQAAEALEEKLSEKMKKKGNDEKLSKALKSLKKSGIDPARDVKEVAFCFEPGMKDGIAAIGGNFAGKDPLGALAAASEEADGKELEKQKSDGVEYVKDGKSFFAAVAPNVLLITKSKADFADLKAGEGSDEGWDVDKSRILSFAVNDKKGKFSGTVSENGEDLDVKFLGDFAGDTGDKIEESPKQFKAQLEKMRDQFELKLKKGPFKKIADDIGNAKFKVDGSKVTVSLTMPASDLGDAIKKASGMNEDELETAVDL